jgi:hypothetical protein
MNTMTDLVEAIYNSPNLEKEVKIELLKYLGELLEEMRKNIFF